MFLRARALFNSLIWIAATSSALVPSLAQATRPKLGMNCVLYTHNLMAEVNAALDPKPIDLRKTGFTVQPDNSLVFFNPETGQQIHLANKGPDSFIQFHAPHPFTNGVDHSFARIQMIRRDEQGFLHVEVSLLPSSANESPLVFELDAAVLATTHPSHHCAIEFEKLRPKLLAPIPGITVTKLNNGTTLIKTERGAIGNADKNHRSISLQLRGDDTGRDTPARIITIDQVGDRLRVEVEVALKDPMMDLIRSPNGDMKMVRRSTPRAKGEQPRFMLTDSELRTAHMSLNSRDMHTLIGKVADGHNKRHLGATTAPDLRPAGGFDIGLARRWLHNRNLKKEILEETMAKLLKAGGNHSIQVDDMGRRVRSVSLENESRRAWMLKNLAHEESLRIFEMVAEIPVFKVDKLTSRKGQAKGNELALRHPEMQQHLDIMAKHGVRLDIDPALDLVRAGAQYSWDGVVTIPPDARWRDFVHEYHHFMFDKLGINGIYNRLLRASVSGRLDAELSSPTTRESLLKLRGQVSPTCIDQLIWSARNQLPENAANEGFAVQSELDLHHKDGISPQSNEYKRTRAYAVKWQVHDLSKLVEAGHATPTQIAALKNAEKELKELGSVR